MFLWASIVCERHFTVSVLCRTVLNLAMGYSVPAGTNVASDSYQVSHLSPEPDRRAVERGLICIDLGAFPDKINLVAGNNLCALEQLPEDEQNGHDDLHGVVCEEISHAPRLEGGVTIEDDNKDHPTKTNVGAVWLEAANVRKGLSVDTLSLASLVECNID